MDTDPDRVMLLTVAAWIPVHLMLVVAVGLPDYTRCINGPRTGCGGIFGVVALVIGLFQVFYGLAGLVLCGRFLGRRPAVAQGIVIGMGLVVMLHTLL